MRSVTRLVMVGFVLCGGLAYATMDQGENSLGVYFAPDCETNCIDVAASQSVDMYFMLANATQPSIGGFEFSWYLDPQPAVVPIITSIGLPPSAINIGDAGNVLVGLGEPLVTGGSDECTLLMTIGLFIITPFTDTCVMLGPSTPSSLGGVPAYVDGVDPGLIVPMTYSTYDPDNGWDVDANGFICVAMFGCPGPVGAETHTFGDIKSLFK